RPYGFVWKAIGRIDALEVLATAARQLNTAPYRVYLTGHSMGGHGAWQVGVQTPGRFAAIGPSAGWISFFSYAGSPRLEPKAPIEEILSRAASPIDTVLLKHNYANAGIYILHGEKDDN